MGMLSHTHGQVGMLNQCLCVLTVCGIQSDTEAGGEADALTIDFQRLTQDLQQFVCDASRLFDRIGGRQQDCKLIAAQTGDGIRFA